MLITHQKILLKIRPILQDNVWTKKNRINSNPSNVLFAHLFRDHGFRLQCSGDILHGICKDCENKSDQL